MTRIRPRRRPPTVVGLISRDVEPAQEAILEELRRVLISGGAPPGTELPLDEMAGVFGVSHTPVREALKTLLGEGLVEHRARAGYTVARLSKADFSELYVVREALESAALGPAVVNAGDEDRSRAAAVHRDQSAALGAGDATAYHRGSRDFHRALIRPSGMHRLMHMIDSTWNITEPAQPMTLLSLDSLDDLHADHAAMLQAFSDGATDALRQHSGRHAQRLCGLVESLPVDHPAFASRPLPSGAPR